MEASRGALLAMVMAVVLACSSCKTCTNNSHVVTTFKELISETGVSEFKGSFKAQNYSELLITNGNLYVGARNYVFLVDRDNFTELKVEDYSSTPVDTRRCIQSNRPKEECYNFIRVLQPFQGRLFVCGTNSYKPICMWKNLTDLSTATGRDNQKNLFFESVDGVGLAPYSPKFYSTGIMSEQGRYYAGTMRDGAGRDSTIFSIDFKRRTRILETIRNRNWLSESEFVKSFNVGKYVYFYFREVAIENGCTKTKFSRVARICKGDYGGTPFVMKKNFVTFNKARIVCQTLGQYPAYFDEIQDVFWDERTSAFYAVFTTQPNGVDGSAICAFTRQDIERVFNGDYKYYDQTTRNWVSRGNQHHFQNCSVKASSRDQSLSNSYGAKLVPKGMMATRIMTGAAIEDSKNYQLMDDIVYPRTISAQYIKHGIRFNTIAVDHVVNRIVIYAGTDKGSILRLFKPIGHNESCILEEIKISEGENSPITNMQLDSQKGYLYVANNNKLVKVQLSRCERHKDKDSCIQAHDPYCGWSSGRCTSWKNRDPNSGWEQDLSECPTAKPVWSEWSKWKVCEQDNGNLCQCRTRKCLNTCDPANCPGSATDLKQCTVDKYFWTSEADWLRKGVIHGNWSQWTQWTPCSVTLGVGIKKRYRFCMNPRPSNGGRRCLGDSKQYEECRVDLPLKEMKRLIWTQAMGVLGKENLAVRVMYSCTVRGHDLTNMTLNITKIDQIDCTQNREVCKIPPTIAPGLWSTWAEWSKCKFVGVQHRTRECKDVDKPCVGLNKQERQCYPDSVTSTPTQAVPTPATTKETEIDPSWNTWSRCRCGFTDFKIIMSNNDSKKQMGLKHRSRRCRGMTGCPDDQVQYKPCTCDSTTLANKYEETTDATKTGYRIGDVLGAAIITGVLVLVLCAVMAYIVIRRRKNFDVSKAFEKSIQESSNESRYERTNGENYPNENSKDKNSSTKLQPVVVEAKSSRSLKDVFKKKRKQEPESV